jgi:hypothetical protein
MNRTTVLAAAAVSLALVSWVAPATAQTTKSVAGVYTIHHIDAYGPGARGMMILTPDGHYSINLARATLPKFASNSRVKGTDEENKAVVSGSIFHFGTYTVDEGGKFITFNIKASAFPNFDNTTQKRALTVKGDELTYLPTVASGGEKPQPVVWKKMK